MTSKVSQWLLKAVLTLSKHASCKAGWLCFAWHWLSVGGSERTEPRRPVGWCRWSASDKPDFLWDFHSQCFPVTWPAFSFLQSVQGLQASSQSVQYPAVSFPPQHLLPVSATQQFPMVPYFMCATFPLGEHVHQFYYLPMQGCVMLDGCPGLTVKGREWGSHSRTLQLLSKIMVSILSSVPCLLLLQSGTILRIYWLNRDWMSWEFEVRNRERHELVWWLGKQLEVSWGGCHSVLLRWGVPQAPRSPTLPSFSLNVLGPVGQREGTLSLNFRPCQWKIFSNMWRHHDGSLTATAMGDGDTTHSASLQKAETSGKPHWPFRTKGTKPSLLQHPPEQLKPLVKKIIICFYWKMEIWSNCLPSLILLRIKICFPCYVLLLFWTENSFLLLFAIWTPSFAHSDEHVASACPCVPLPWPGCSCQFPLCFCAERRRDNTVHPDEPEPAVLRRDPWAPTWSRLPAVPHGTANPAAELRHCLYRPAAPYSRVLRLWTSHLPASPPAPSLSTGICSTASTCSGEWALSSHLWSIAYS